MVFGDHGMADATGVVDLLTPLARLPLKMKRDFLYFVDSTMARFWFFRDGVREQVADLLARIRGGQVLEDDELERLGVLYPDRRYGELIYLADPGVLFVPSFMGKKPIAAMHGYHPDHEDGDTLFLTNFDHRPLTKTRDLGPFLTEELEALGR
jgi:hypothetical protein